MFKNKDISLEEKFIENSDHPEFYRYLIEELGFKVKKEKQMRLDLNG